VGIDEDTALVSAGGGWRVEGRQQVWIVDREERRTAYPAGSGPALPAPAAGTKPVIPAK
jgi:hypothetical protein